MNLDIETYAALKKELARKDELLLEALPFVEDSADSPVYRDGVRPAIRGLAKRIKAEVEKKV